MTTLRAALLPTCNAFVRACIAEGHTNDEIARMVTATYGEKAIRTLQSVISRQRKRVNVPIKREPCPTCGQLRSVPCS